MQKTKNILTTSNLSVGYTSNGKTISVAENLNLQFQEGKLITLIGANGIGKSTLLKTLTGIQKPLLGAIFLKEKDIQEYSSSELAQNLSIVLTEKLPPSLLTVYELVALGRQPYTNWVGKLAPEDSRKITEAMQLTQIEHLSHKKHFEISDGELQKVLVARALAQDTPFIVLDEPTTHLDLLHKVSLFRLLKKLSKETGKCILFSTHDIDLAIQLSDEMVVMTNKKVIQDKPSNLIANGVFKTLFDDVTIEFDAEKERFLFQ